jgi:sulfate adenylyltransferase
MPGIRPHGSDSLQPRYVEDPIRRAALRAEAEGLPAITLSSAAAANAVMLASGYFNPLEGYMDRRDALSVADALHTHDGLFWPIPILNLTREISALGGAERIALRDPNRPGHPIFAVQQLTGIDQLSRSDLERITERVFGTLDPDHPGVATLHQQGSYLLAGPIEVLDYSYFPADFPDTFRTAQEIRTAIDDLGWQRVVAFQTRNPMHRAHEALCKMAAEAVDADGLLIHMLLGQLKPGDIPAEVRDAAIRKMVELYFPPHSVLISGYGFDMLYAGPREAVLHAVFRQNAGCTHLIVGRDHAGVGDYYGPFDAQEVFDREVPAGALEIEIFRADHTAYSKRLQRVVMMRDAPDHGREDFVLLSGTKVRALLAAGEDLPEEFARPEVADILKRYYSTQGEVAASA